MFPIRLTDRVDDDRTRVLPIAISGTLSHETGLPAAEIAALAGEIDGPGQTFSWPRPLGTPERVVLAGIGAGDEAGWRSAGAAAVRAVPGDQPFQVVLAGTETADAVRALAEGLWLGGYRYRDGRDEPRTAEVDLVTPAGGTYPESLTRARVAAQGTWLARDLTNAPSSLKSPDWLAEEVVGAAAKRAGLTVRVRSGDELARFGGLRAVGGGSAFAPCLVELSWAPAGAGTHVVLVGKGITFDSGGISIKTRPQMKLMRMDMGGAAVVAAVTLAAADLSLPVRVTALLPLAENAISGSAFRPGDVITHYDGTTTETTNSDAEGRLVLADALAYAAAELAPDVLIDVATLTGSAVTALGPAIAALLSPDDDLAGALTEAGRRSGERMWRLPLAEEYREHLRSDVADRHSSPLGGPGAVVAGLFLHEFLGDAAPHWAHLDIAGPAWADETELERNRGATGWGVRTLLRWLEGLAVSA